MWLMRVINTDKRAVERQGHGWGGVADAAKCSELI